MDFAGLGGRDTVSYDDFCRVLEVAANNSYAAATHRDNREDGMYSRSREAFERGRTTNRDSRERDYWGGPRDASTGPLDTDNVERWLSRSASPKQRREFEHIYDDLTRFKEEQQREASYRDSRDRDRNRDRDFPLALDQSIESDGRRLRPPTVSSSRDFDDHSRSRTPLSSSHTFDRDIVNRSIERDRDRGMRSESPKPPRTSPSKVGSKMWGSSTSLDLKGQTPKIDSGLWTCRFACMSRIVVEARSASFATRLTTITVRTSRSKSNATTAPFSMASTLRCAKCAVCLLKEASPFIRHETKKYHHYVQLEIMF